MKSLKTEIILELMLLTLDLFTYNIFLLIFFESLYFTLFYVQLSMQLKQGNCLGLLLRSSPSSDQQFKRDIPDQSFNWMQ